MYYHVTLDEFYSQFQGTKPQKDKNLRPIQFEKDDDTNHHIDFIAAVANLRARNYKIEEASRSKVKMIAGKIIPAIATTTAMVVGAVGFEILKFIMVILTSYSRKGYNYFQKKIY